jgi:hypothetical protein
MANLTKVIFEYSDGTFKYLDSSELEKWLAFNAIVAQSAENHGCNPPWKEIKWIKIGKEKHY